MRALFIGVGGLTGDEMYVSDLPAPSSDKYLRELQAHVGGYIEAVFLKDGVMYINEEGKISNLPANKLATELAHQNKAIFDWDHIAGNAVIVGLPNRQGNDTPIPDGLKKTIQDLWGVQA